MTRRAPSTLDALARDWWFTICALALIVSSDVKFRVRDPGATLGGQLDVGVLLEICTYGAVGLWIVVLHGRPLRMHRTELQLFLLAFFVGLMVLSVTYSEFPEYAAVRAGQMIVLLGLATTAARVCSRAELHRFAHGYLVLVIGLIGIGVVIPSEPVTALQAGRFSWLAVHPTVSGAMCGLGVVLAAGYLTASRNPRHTGVLWPRSWYVLALLITVGATLATQTRGAALAALLGSVVVLSSLRAGRAALRLQMMLVLATSAIFLGGGEIVNRFFERGSSRTQLLTLNSRTDLWELAIDASAQRPMFGYGVTSARGIFLDTTGLGGGHNALINVLVELGAVGALTWAALIFVVIVRIRRLPFRSHPRVRTDRALLLGIITFLLVNGFFSEGVGAVSNVAATWLFVCTAWLTVARRSIPRVVNPSPSTTDWLAALSRGSDLLPARLRRRL